ncbi:MAG: hypothetical protein M3680_24730 [Myxococcota bacterium]|nr:hypothetical protein [Myxococcota bacterium]
MTAKPRLEVMQIVTGCSSIEQFVSVFHRFCDAQTCFIPLAELRPVGTELAFSLRLADGTPMIGGTCVVMQAWSTIDNPYRRPGLQLQFLRLTTESTAVFHQLLARRKVASRSASPTADLEPLLGTIVPPPRPPAGAVKPAAPAAAAALRAPHSPHVLPANPLTDFSDDTLHAFVDATVAEERDPVAAIAAESERGLRTKVGLAPTSRRPGRPARVAKPTQPIPVFVRDEPTHPVSK